VLTCPQFSPAPLFNVKNDAPLEVQEDYNLFFEDTFNNPLQPVDPAKWSTRFLWGPGLTINNEEQYYVDVLGGDTTNQNPFSIDPATGRLLITAAPITGTKPVTTNGLDGGQNYTSGILTTREFGCFTYGYVEVCAFVPCGMDGAWPAFWALNCRYYNNASEKAIMEGIANPTPHFNPEIDFSELVQGNNNSLNCSNNALHYFSGDQQSSTDYRRWSLDEGGFRSYNINTQSVDSNFNIYQDCNGDDQFLGLPADCNPSACGSLQTFGMHWCPEFLKYYRNGQVVNCITGAADIIPDQEMYLLINLAVGGNYPFGNPPSQLADPASYPAAIEIAYARIYTKP